MDEYRFVGSHPDELDGGRPLEPGEFTGPIDIDEDHPKNRQLLDDGYLIKVEAGTGPDNVLRGEALNRRAAELDIEGRSQMSADELRDAVAVAEANDDKEG